MGGGGVSVKSELETDAVLAGTSEKKTLAGLSRVLVISGVKSGLEVVNKGRTGRQMMRGGCSGRSSQESLCWSSQVSNESWVSRSASLASSRRDGAVSHWLVRATGCV